MESQLYDASAAFNSQSSGSVPITPQPENATLPDGTAVTKEQSDMVDSATKSSMTPPPSTQVQGGNRKSRTPTPTYSHISTPPPTVGASSQANNPRTAGAFARTMTSEQIETASPEALRNKVAELQAAYQEAKMSAAHHKLQYQMLSQESAAAIERMAVEARMAQSENEAIHVAEQAKTAVTLAQPAPIQDGTIPVQKDLYQKMCREIQHLTEAYNFLQNEHHAQEKIVLRQENEIASLTDKVILLRDRIREKSEHSRLHGAGIARHVTATPRSVYSTPRRAPMGSQEQPFAALLQASELASQAAGAGRSAPSHRGHSRNTHSMSSLPATPNRGHRHGPVFQTPQGRYQPVTIPSTAPVARSDALHRTPDIYAQQVLPVPVLGPASDGTVSDPEHHADDSEAETDIIEPDEINESQASRAASQMLRSSQEQQAQRESFSGRGMLQQQQQQAKTSNVRQTKLFGQVKKSNVVRAGEDEVGPPAKRARTNMSEGVGLGIVGVGRH